MPKMVPGWNAGSEININARRIYACRKRLKGKSLDDADIGGRDGRAIFQLRQGDLGASPAAVGVVIERMACRIE